jgi:hypothetical protein
VSAEQLTVLASITVFAAVIVQDPVYAVRAVPVGTPVFVGPGKHPPWPFAPPGVYAGALHVPDAGSATASTRKLVGGGTTVCARAEKAENVRSARMVAKAGKRESSTKLIHLLMGETRAA